ncbi:MAG TPA: signal recognition particle-docking protein FtsY, partial [Nitrospirae bacterium]|nr:signal recognition particle-docking protein FtsY [Nitrospirota bacterium]
MGFFDKLKTRIQKTKSNLIEKVETVFQNKKIDEASVDEFEEILISADFGAQASNEIAEMLREKIRDGQIKTLENLKSFLRTEMTKMLGRSQPIVFFGEKPFVILTVGVNGAGKTTTIGKLASRFVSEGFSVMLGAGDTFRAAAIEQLDLWASRSGANIIKHESGSDPAAVAFDTVESAKSRGVDVVIIDTAGRLQTKTSLMEELKKINRVIKKSFADAPQETLLVLDATTGQNALSQARLFNEAIGITGIALTKLDGTAKGGIIFAIKKELNIPVRLIGIGEKIEDLRDFNP